MDVSDKCAIKGKQNEKPDFSTLLSYGNESILLEKLIAETEKEMQSVMDAEQRKDLQELDALTHHLRSSWEALNKAVTAVLNIGAEIIRLAKEERRKYNNG